MQRVSARTRAIPLIPLILHVRGRPHQEKMAQVAEPFADEAIAGQSRDHHNVAELEAIHHPVLLHLHLGIVVGLPQSLHLDRHLDEGRYLQILHGEGPEYHEEERDRHHTTQ